MKFTIFFSIYYRYLFIGILTPGGGTGGGCKNLTVTR